MKDSETGKVKAVFAMDYPANKWTNPAILNTGEAGLIVLILYILLVTFYIIIRNGFREKENKGKLQNIIYGTNAGTWEWNMQTGELTINDVWAGIIGYSIKELGLMNVEKWESLVHPDDVVKYKAVLQRYLSGETVNYYFEYRIKHKNGLFIWVNDNGKIVERDSDGNPTLMAGIHLDINEQKKKIDEVVQLNKYMVGRELKMIELKKRINDLENK